MTDMTSDQIFILMIIGLLIYFFFHIIIVAIQILPPEVGQLILIPFIFLFIFSIGTRILFAGILGFMEAKGGSEFLNIIRSVISIIAGAGILIFTGFLFITIFLQTFIN